MAHSDDGAKGRAFDNMAAAGEDDEYELDQDEIIQTILMLGNEIWKNFG